MNETELKPVDTNSNKHKISETNVPDTTGTRRKRRKKNTPKPFVDPTISEEFDLSDTVQSSGKVQTTRRKLPLNNEARLIQFQKDQVRSLAEKYEVKSYVIHDIETIEHKDWFDEEEQNEQLYNTRSKDWVQRKGGISVTPEQLRRQPQLTDVYKTIRDIVLRSFVPGPKKSLKDMMNFVHILMIRHNVIVYKSTVTWTNKQKSVSERMVTGFMIVEKNLQLSQNRKDNACVLHLLAVKPEARCFGVATAMMKQFAKEHMRGSRIVVAVMYPQELLPMTPVHPTLAKELRKIMKPRASKNHCEKIEKMALQSPVYFFMNKFKFLIWNFVDERLQQHGDLKETLCMFGEKVVLKELKLPESPYQKDSALVEIQYSNCNAMKVEYVTDNDSEKYQLVLQTCLIGQVDIVVSKYDKQALIDGTDASQQLGTSETKNQEHLNRDWQEVYRESMVDNLWNGSKIGNSWEKQIKNGIRSYFGKISDGTKLVKKDYVHIKGMGRKENAFMEGQLGHGDSDDTRLDDETFYTMTIGVDNVALVPGELRQDIEGNHSTCAYLSALLLIRSRDRIKGYTMIEYMKRSDGIIDLNNLPFFKKKKGQSSLCEVLSMFGYVLKKIGKVNYRVLLEEAMLNGTYLCSIETKHGMHHCIAIDGQRRVIWDASCDGMRKITGDFFEKELMCNKEEKNMFLVEMIAQKGHNLACSTWIDREVKVKKDGSVGTIIYVDYYGTDKKEKGFGVVMRSDRSFKKFRKSEVERI